MDFTRQLVARRRRRLENIFRRIGEALQPFAYALDWFLATLFSGRLPADWRQQWHEFVADQATKGFFVAPQSVRELEDWIEAWARYCELLPITETQPAVKAESVAAYRPFVANVAPNVSVPPAPPETDGMSAEERNHVLQFARRCAYLEQQRLDFSDDEWAQYEYYLYQNILRRVRGERPLPQLQCWIDRNDAFNQKRRGPTRPPRDTVNVAKTAEPKSSEPTGSFVLASTPNVSGPPAAGDTTAATAPRPSGQQIGPTARHYRERFFYEKAAAAQGYLEEIRRLLEALGEKLDGAKTGEQIEVDAEVDTVTDLIWRHNDAMESARDAWLHNNLSGDLIYRLNEMHTPLRFGLPWFIDDDQAARARKQQAQICQRLGQRDAAMDRLIIGMRVVEGVGILAGFVLGGGLLGRTLVQGGKWVFVKELAVVGAAALAEQGVEKGLRAAGASEQTIRGFRLAAVVVSFIILRRRSRSAGAETQAPAPKKPDATPSVQPKGKLLPPAEAKRRVGVAFNKAWAPAYPNNEVPIAKPHGGKPYALDSYDPIKREIVFRRATQFSEIQFKSAKTYFREFVKKYPPGSMIADVPSAKGLAGQKLEGRMYFEVPPQWKAIPQAVLREAARYDIIIRDSNGRIYHAD
jgi:TolA-binding protein